MSSEYHMIKNDTIGFWILDTEIELLQSETAYGLKTVAIVHDPFTQNEVYYLDAVPVSVETAINLFQDLNNCFLSDEEFSRVLRDNNLAFPK